MNPLHEFLVAVVGGCIGIAIALPAFKRSRERLGPALCGVVAVAFTLPLHGWLFAGVDHDWLILPLLGGVLGCVGGLIGAMVGRWLARGASK
jgi:uncharacterized membrane protein YfcA